MASEELQGRGDPRVLLPSSLSPGLFAAVTWETRRCERKWAEEACQVFEPRSPPRISGGCFCPAGAELGLEVDIKRRDLAHGGCNMLCWLFSNFWGLFPLSEVKLHACALWRKARLPQGSAGSGEELGRGGVFTANVKSSRVLILAKAGALGGFVELRALPRLLSGGKGESTAGQKCQSPCLSACLPVSHPLAYRQGGGEARRDGVSSLHPAPLAQRRGPAGTSWVPARERQPRGCDLCGVTPVTRGGSQLSPPRNPGGIFSI